MIGKLLLGGAIGGVAGIATGDNYSSTATARNFATGVLAGAGGVGAASLALKYGPRALGSATGLRQMMNAQPGNRLSAFRGSPLGQAATITSKGLGMGVGLASAMARNPGITFSAAIMGGSALYLGNKALNHGIQSPDMNTAELSQRDSLSGFQGSAAGLTFGLWRNRHRG